MTVSKGLPAKKKIKQLKQIEVTTSIPGEMSKLDWRAWMVNLFKFSLPTVGIFFGLLAQGIPLDKAWPLAAYAFYQAIADYISKKGGTNIRITE